MNVKLFIHIVVATFALLTVWSIYGAWYAHVEHTSNQAAELATQIQMQTERTKQTQLSKDELAEIAANQILLQKYFVSTGDIVSFLQSLKTTGQGLGSSVTVDSVAAEQGTPHNHLNISLSITGTFDSVERTLGSLENNPHDVTLTNASLKSKGDGKTASQWTATVTLRVGTLATPAATSRASSGTPTP